MSDFSTILALPDVRAIVQDGTIVRAFEDALLPKFMFREEATDEEFPIHIGDSLLRTAPGLIKSKRVPSKPGVDPDASTYTKEQWRVTPQPYDESTDIHMPTSAMAAVDLFMRDGHQVGVAMAEKVNAVARNRIYNAAESGNTVATAQVNAGGASVHVRRLNGLTTARNPGVAGASEVQFAAVSSSNKIGVRITLDDLSFLNTFITAFTPDVAGDEIGPGTITIADAVPGGRNIPARSPVLTTDHSIVTRQGGGDNTDAISGSDVFTLAGVRAAHANLRLANVPTFEDTKFHWHLDPISVSQIFNDTEWRVLQTALPDFYQYKDQVIGVILGGIFVEDSVCPLSGTVYTVGDDGISYDTTMDQFAGDLTSNGTATGTVIHRAVAIGADWLREYWVDQDQYLSDAGITGKIGDVRLVNNNVEYNTDHITMIYRAPIDKKQEFTSVTCKMTADWVPRTDAAVRFGPNGGKARYKRCALVEHGE